MWSSFIHVEHLLHLIKPHVIFHKLTKLYNFKNFILNESASTFGKITFKSLFSGFYLPTVVVMVPKICFPSFVIVSKSPLSLFAFTMTPRTCLLLVVMIVKTCSHQSFWPQFFSSSSWQSSQTCWNSPRSLGTTVSSNFCALNFHQKTIK